MKKMLRFFKRIIDKTMGSIIDEWYWQFRHIGEKEDWAKVSLAPENIQGVKDFVGHIVAHGPFQNILEVGCASGFNLTILAEQFPNAKFYGIDLSTHAIRCGQKYLASHHLDNVSLDTGRAEDLRKFSDKSIDIVFTNAVLIYVGPDKVKTVVKEMLRVTKKAIVLMEWNTDKEYSVYADHWAHNWKNLFGELGINNIRLTKLNPDPWQGYGYLVEVILS